MVKIEKITNYSSKDLGVVKQIPNLKRTHWIDLKFDVGGDAPKSFLAVYEFEQDGIVRKSNPKTWNKFVAKVGQKWYPQESITEYFLNQMGEVLCLNIAKSKLAVINGQLRFLSKYFLAKDELLTHGAEIFSGYVEDKQIVEEIEQKRLAATFFTFQFAESAINQMFPEKSKQIMEDFVKMLIFDCITGNKDRHFYNWGVIKNIKNKKSPTFAPIFDTARGLFWNDSDEVIDNWFSHPRQLDDKIRKYAEASVPKIGWEGKEKLNHFDLVEAIVETDARYFNIAKELSSQQNLEKTLELLETQFKKFFSKNRTEAIKMCLEYRFERVQKLVIQKGKL